MAHEALGTLAQLLTQMIRRSMSIDWTRKESVRAKMRIEVRKPLARCGYPPDLQKAAVAPHSRQRVSHPLARLPVATASLQPEDGVTLSPANGAVADLDSAPPDGTFD